MADLANPHPPSEGSIESLSFRLNLYLTLGVASYAALITGLHRAHISLLDLVNYAADYESTRSAAVRLLAAQVANLCTPLALVASLGALGVETAAAEKALHFLSLVVALLLLFSPVGINRRARPGHAALWSAFRRCMRTGMAEADHGKFGDLLISDGLVSYGRAFPEVLILGIKGLGLDSQAFERTEFGFALTSLVFVWPLVVRAAQCWRDDAALNARAQAGQRDRKQEFNMYKYLLAMVTSLTIRVITWERSLDDVDGEHDGAVQLWLHLWRVLAFANLAYSFYWDVAQDWGLEVLRLSKPGLRAQLLLGPPALYWGVVVFDFLARFPWLAPGMHIHPDYPAWTPVLLGSLEVVRRGVWCFFRAELQQIVNERGADKGEVEVPLEEVGSGYRD